MTGLDIFGPLLSTLILLPLVAVGVVGVFWLVVALLAD